MKIKNTGKFPALGGTPGDLRVSLMARSPVNSISLLPSVFISGSCHEWKFLQHTKYTTANTKCHLLTCLFALYLREGNPLVYSGAVSMVNGNPIAGDVVDVVDSSGKLIAWGKGSTSHCKKSATSFRGSCTVIHGGEIREH